MLLCEFVLDAILSFQQPVYGIVKFMNIDIVKPQFFGERVLSGLIIHAE